jgi:hypothetical protein
LENIDQYDKIIFMNEDLEQIHEELEKIKDIVSKDHHMLGVMYRYHRWSRAFVLLKILVFAAIAFGAYYIVEPMILPLVDTYQKVSGAGAVLNSSSTGGFMDAITNFRK